MKKVKNGFVPALGTPIDENGNLIASSYEAQINRMIDAGAVALLCMGSMGQQAFLRTDVCTKTAETAVRAAAGRVPVFVGAMDNSIARAKERIAAMEHLDLTAFVFTTPYYESGSRAHVMHYFRSIAAATKHDIMLYDLPSVTNFKITYDMVEELYRDVPNLKGIKSGDIFMIRKIKTNPMFKDFQVFYSGLDAFDVAYTWGIEHVLDGMFSCTPVNGEKLIAALDAGDRTAAAEALNNIISLRDVLLENDLWPAYTVAMNLLGFEGFHAPDWSGAVSAQAAENVRNEMIRIGELKA